MTSVFMAMRSATNRPGQADDFWQNDRNEKTDIPRIRAMPDVISVIASTSKQRSESEWQ